MLINFLITFLLCLFSAHSETVTPSKEMNGVKYEKYKNFDKRWKLVTVRFRQDTEEMRFTYANPLAYETLRAGKTDYPDGAIFGKVGVRTGHDPLFESSLVPMGARRYQLMVRNKKKYKEQSGWGYALFDERGIPFPEDHKTQVVACASCHNVAEERGYVFSQFTDISPRITKKSNNKILFKMVPRSELAENILKHIPNNFNFVRIMISGMSANVFQGTLEEVRPLLSREALDSKQPVIFKSDDNQRFTLVFPENLGAFCSLYGKSGIYMKSMYTNIDKGNSLSELSYCMAN